MKLNGYLPESVPIYLTFMINKNSMECGALPVKPLSQGRATPENLTKV